MSLKKVLFKLIRYSGLPFVVREIVQKNRVTILIFHEIGEETADMTFECLSKLYNIISLDDFIEAVEKKDDSTIPEKALIITFDDGRIKNYEMLPSIKHYKVPVTIFLCSSIINTNRHAHVKYKDKAVPIEAAGALQLKEYDTPQALQRTQIDEMRSHVNFQSHTMFHPILPRCEYDEARKEIFGSKEMLEKEFGLRINAIAYPNGDYSERDIQFVKQAGYRCGITVDFGYNTVMTDPFRLKRLGTNDSDDVNELIVKASGVWAFFKTLNGRRQGYGHSASNDGHNGHDVPDENQHVRISDLSQ